MTPAGHSRVEQRKTVLLFRSSTMSHCLQIFNYLKQFQPTDNPSRWIWIIQPQMEERIREACGGDMEFWVYDGPNFTCAGLAGQFAARLRGINVDSAYIPLNNPEGKGYTGLIRFLSRMNIHPIYVHRPLYYLESITLYQWIYRRIRNIILEMGLRFAVLVSVPAALVYYLLRGRFAGGRRL